jgi:hypothetical protein
MLWRINPAEAREVAISHLMSPYAALRDKAFKLSGLTREALLTLTEKRLRSPGASSSDIRVGLQLLGSSGKKDYAELAHSFFLVHPAATVRGVALLTLARLSPDDARPLLLPAVANELSAVGRAAVQAALTLELKPSQAEWRELAAQSKPDAVAQRVHRWARELGKWLELALLLEIASKHPQHSRFCLTGIQRWMAGFNNSWQIQDSATRDWIDSNLPRAKEMGLDMKTLKFFLN